MEEKRDLLEKKLNNVQKAQKQINYAKKVDKLFDICYNQAITKRRKAK